MRSPASKTATLYSDAQETKTPDSFEDYHRLRVAALRSLPYEVAQDIIQHEPQDSYRNVQVERDRRLRLIIRRYENQIQYGCHNRNCATSTCLSYRRRHSKTPVRRYTAASARALACHLVEEASRNRRDPTLGFCPNQPVVPWYQDPRTTQERRNPATTTPSKQPRTQINGTARGPQEKQLSTTSHPVNVNSSPSRRRSQTNIEGPQATAGASNLISCTTTTGPNTQAPGNPDSGHESGEALETTAKAPPTAKDLPNGEIDVSHRRIRSQEDIIAHREVDGRTKYLVVWHEGQDTKMAWTAESTIQNQAALTKYKRNHGPEDALDSNQLANLEAAFEASPITKMEDQVEEPLQARSENIASNKAPNTSKIDFASFTQTLWNTLTLQRLESPKQSPEKESAKQDETNRHLPEVVEAEYDVDVSEHEESQDLKEFRPQCMHTNTAFRGFTLRRLSWFNLEWLLSSAQETDRHTGSPFEAFIKQSVYHSFGNPNRLLESALSWHAEGDDTDDDDNTSGSSSAPSSPLETRFAADGAATESSVSPRHDVTAPTRHSVQFDPSDTITAFQIVEILLKSTDVLFDALHDTIQQCYNVDHPGYDGERAAQLARKAFKGLGGGLYDTSGKATGSPGDPIQQTGRLPDRKQISEIFLLTLIALVTPLFNHRWSAIGFDAVKFIIVADLRSDNKAGFNAHAPGETTRNEREAFQVLTEVLDHLQDWHRCRLASALMDCISHHVAATEIRRIKSRPRIKPRSVIDEVFELLHKDLNQRGNVSRHDVGFRLMVAMGIIDVARTVLLKDWDRATTVSRTGPVGGALELLAALHHRFEMFELGSPANLFEMPFVAAAFDEMELPNHWLQFEPSARQTHILNYPFLFETATLVKYFRAINITAMKSSFETASMVWTDAYTFLQTPTIPVYGGREVLQAMRPYMAKYFVLTIRRSKVLEDAINQLWRRQRREVLRPLRVRLGRDEGEDGLDHGGVQQEFFRLAFAEAFNADHGMFTVDDRTRMTWFQPGSLEPSWRFEAVGILMGMAVYNGVNLPITMPLAFYRKLLDFKVKKLEHIKDGWPDLEKGLRQLLEYDGDVAEDIGRTYEFSYEFGGHVYTKDISRNRDHRMHAYSPPPPVPSRKGKEKVAKSPTFELPPALIPAPGIEAQSASPSPDLETVASSTSSPIPALDAPISISTPLSTPSPSRSPAPSSSSSPSIAPPSRPATPESPLVTNANREAYIRDYIAHLTDHAIAPQYAAFVRGFHTCLHPRALRLFTPAQLRDVIEGTRAIDIDDLERHASYEDFDRGDAYVRGFWDVVREEAARDSEWAGQLLEFVLASARVPVGGWGEGSGRGSFVVQRNGEVWVDADADAGSQQDGASSSADGGGGAAADQLDGAAPSGEGRHDGQQERTATAAATAAAATATGEKSFKGRLPSSSTCYARLLLPRYRVIGEDEDAVETAGKPPVWKEVLRERLRKAVGEGRGFGML